MQVVNLSKIYKDSMSNTYIICENIKKNTLNVLLIKLNKKWNEIDSSHTEAQLQKCMLSLTLAG